MAQRQRHNVEDVDGAGSNPAGCTETDLVTPVRVGLLEFEVSTSARPVAGAPVASW